MGSVNRSGTGINERGLRDSVMLYICEVNPLRMDVILSSERSTISVDCNEIYGYVWKCASEL